MPSAAALRIEIERSLERRFPAALTPAPRTIREVAGTGIAGVDEQLDGGLPVGAISEVTGPESSGRTSLALAFVARRTGEGRSCAWVDVSDALEPESAAANGVVLRQLLWVRCGDGAGRAQAGAAGRLEAGKAGRARQGLARPGWTRLDQALRATDLLLQAGGFAAIVLDLGDTAREQGMRIPLATWFRFRQAADRTRCSLVVLGRAAYAQSSAAMVLECKALGAVTAGETALRGFAFEVRGRRERFAAVETGMRKAELRTAGAGRWGGKPPAAEWQSSAAWDAEKRA